MESVFREKSLYNKAISGYSFNPWFNGICIQGVSLVPGGGAIACFNPWFNGICIQGQLFRRTLPVYREFQSLV